MATRAIAADGEVVVNNETFVSSALAFPVRCFLPAINAGSGGTASVADEIRFQSTGNSIEICTNDGRRVGIVEPRTSAVVVAKTGLAQSADDVWAFDVLPQTPAAKVTGDPTNLASVTAGVDALAAVLINAGLMKAE